MKTPKWIDIEITKRCNLRCPSCTGVPVDGGQELPAEEWLQFFEELNACAVPGVTMTGTEPFVREDLEELIEGIVQNRMRFSIRTNGTLVTDDTASMLAATGRCDNVQVSIDGSVPTTREAFRAKGTFYKALHGARILQKHRVPVTVQLTVTRHNAQDLRDIARLLLDELHLSSVSWSSAFYTGLCRKNTEQEMLTTEERTSAMETLLRLSARYSTRINAATGLLAETRTWVRMAEASTNKAKPGHESGFLSGCNGPAQGLAVRCDGVIVPCTRLSHIYLGRINEDSLKEVWQDHPELVLLRKRNRIPLSSFESCARCEYVQHCSGGCPGLAYLLTGSTEQPSPNECLKRFLDEGGRLPGGRGNLESELPKRQAAC